MEADVVGLGCLSVDELLYVDTMPGAEGQARILRRERQHGGLTGTALAAAAVLGASCRYGGLLGTDPAWAGTEADLVAHGVDVSAAPRHAGVRPVLSTIVVSADGERHIYYDDDAPMGAPDDPDPAVLDGARVLLLDGFGMQGTIRAAAAARERDIPRVADLESDADPGVDELAALVDHLVLPWAFAQRWTGAGGAAAAVASLWGPGRDTVVVTDGARGCWYRSREDPEVRHVPAFAVRVVDTTGCGDVFHGAYAAGLAFGLPAAARVDFASAAAALAATGRGGRGALPSRAAVDRLLASHASPVYNVGHGVAGL